MKKVTDESITITQYFSLKTDEELRQYYKEVLDPSSNERIAPDAEIRKACDEINRLIKEGKIFEPLRSCVHVRTVWPWFCEVMAERFYKQGGEL